MIVRIVTMTFRPDAVDTFLAVFERSKGHIRAFPGCTYLELLQGVGDSNTVFRTYSHWDSEADLEAYRHSELFANTWAQTKVLFAAKPEAQSFQRLHELP